MRQILLILCLLTVDILLHPRNTTYPFPDNTDIEEELPKPLLKLISINLKDVSLEQAIIFIEKTGKININFDRDRLPLRKKTTIISRKIRVIDAINKMLINTGTKFEVTKGGHFTIITVKKGRFGALKGRIFEKSSNRRIPNVLFVLDKTEYKTLSNEKGEYYFKRLPVGNYNLKIIMNQGRELVKTDVIIRPGRITFLDIKMEFIEKELVTHVNVGADYYQKNFNNIQSNTDFSQEEVRRSPGSAGDIGRMLTVLPGISRRTNESSELIVRGGSSIENGFYVDGIEVPFPYHMSEIGTQGGYYSIINTDLIQNVNFSAGGFDVSYGNHLSSITEITLRDGNTNEFDGQLDMSFFQIGGVLEGPIKKNRGSWIVSFRKSFFSFLMTLGLIEKVDENPSTFDTNMKIVYDLSSKHRFDFILLTGNSYFKDDPLTHIVTDFTNLSQFTTGLKLSSAWGNNFYSTTSIFFSGRNRKDGEEIRENEMLDFTWEMSDGIKSYGINQINYLNFNKKSELEFGFHIKNETDKLNYFISQRYNDFGEKIDPVNNKYRYDNTEYSAFFLYKVKVKDNFSLSMGLRADYSTTQKSTNIAPRLSMTYQVSQNLFINCNFGIFYQKIPINYLTYSADARQLKSMKATHYTLGLEGYFGKGTRYTIEVYYKGYANLPISYNNPRLLVNDHAIDKSLINDFKENFYFGPTELSDRGYGYTWGVELGLQKKLTDRFYGILSSTYFVSRYKDLLGEWRNRMYDNRIIINSVLGFKPDTKWLLSAKIAIIGGAPYTPIDQGKSLAVNEKVLDWANLLKARYPVFSSINLRIDRRWNFDKSSLVFYLDFWNIVKINSISKYKWDSILQEVEPKKQLPFLPIFGIEYEF